jgi:hypothetical protein
VVKPDEEVHEKVIAVDFRQIQSADGIEQTEFLDERGIGEVLAQNLLEAVIPHSIMRAVNV